MGETRVLSMKHLLTIVLLVSVVSLTLAGNLKNDLQSIHYPNCKWSEVQRIFGHGRHHGFYHPDEIKEVFVWLHHLVPSITKIEESNEKTRPHKKEVKGRFGTKKLEGPDGQHLYAYVFTTQADHNLERMNKPGIVFTAGHRANEPMTVSMIVYVALEWVHLYHNKDVGILHFLERSVAWFIPVVNPDGYKYFIDNWKAASNPPPNRKNRFAPLNSRCTDATLGVDLNRNYDYNWTEPNATDCDQDYPGEKPFSEIETRFVHDIIESYTHPGFKLAVNFVGANGAWRMPHNVTHLHRGYDLYNQIKNDTNMEINDTWTGLTGDITDWMYFEKHITAFSALVGSANENGDFEMVPTHERAHDIFNRTSAVVRHLYAQLVPNLEHDFTTIEENAPSYIPEPVQDAHKYKLMLRIQAFNKGLAPKQHVYIGIKLNHGIHQTRNNVPFHMHYEIISEEEISKANENEVDYSIHGKYTSGELKTHHVKPLTVGWNKSEHHGHDTPTLFSREAITIPERHFLRVYVLVHNKVGRHINFDVKVLPLHKNDVEFTLAHINWVNTPFDEGHGLHAGTIFLIIMTIFLLIFVPLCVCYIYMKRTQLEREHSGDYMMHKGDGGVEML